MRKRLVTLLASVGLLAGSMGVAQADTDGAVVRTDAGPVRGTVSDGYRTFHGIPFAAPPVGELRWRSPQPVTPWTEPRDATREAGPCAQAGGAGMKNENEDCLYLNVTTPTSRNRRKPVMVWLHGGGNSYLSGNGFDAHRLAIGGDVVVVTTNFRLGKFGFLAHPGLPNSGAYGLEDQQAALRWVQRNAGAFGGDPNNVTLFGESGGAFDVCGQLTSPGARGLFHRALAQSGGCTITWPDNGIIHRRPAGAPWISREKAEADGVALATTLGCSAADCLRQVPAASITAIDHGLTPVTFGNRVLPVHPAEALATGRFHRVPVLWGNTRDEGRLVAGTVVTGEGPITEDGYLRLLGEAFGDKAQRIAAEYPSSRFGSPVLAYGAVMTDGVWACSQLADDRLLARRTPTYGFEFADRNAPQGFFKDFVFPPGFPSGAFHSSELAYLFDLAGFVANFTPEQQRLADQMIRYWTRFAATGNPNAHGLPHWSQFRRDNVQSLAPNDIRPVNLNAEHNCGFWASL